MTSRRVTRRHVKSHDVTSLSARVVTSAQSDTGVLQGGGEMH